MEDVIMILVCSSCQKKNRVPSSHLADVGRCGACKASLGPLKEPLEVGEADFLEITREAKVPVLVDFWAPWCGPCRAVAPEVKKAAAMLSGRAIVLKVNTDQNQGLAQRFNVTGIPNFVVLSGGKVIAQQAGAVNAQTLSSFIPRVA